MTKIVILDAYGANPGDLSWDGLRELGELTVYERTKAEETVGRAAEADIVLTNKVVLGRREIEQLPRLRYIGVLATGYNVVDTVAAREHGVTVTNVPAYSTESVAQMVFAHLLTVTNRPAATIRSSACLMLTSHRMWLGLPARHESGCSRWPSTMSGPSWRAVRRTWYDTKKRSAPDAERIFIRWTRITSSR